MKQLSDCKDIIHSCSKCGLCQSVCPIYKITGNDCTVSRGMFIMLKRLMNGELKMSKIINRYLDLCLKCGACSNFCPSGIDVVDIIIKAKAEFFKQNKFEVLKSKLLQFLIKSLNFINLFSFKKKSQSFEKKVIYFGGCGNKIEGNAHIIKILNSMGIEVITPNFSCCGFPFLIRGDINSFNKYIEKFYSVIQNYEEYDILTNCATCEKTLKSYSKWNSDLKNLNIKNVFEYIRENNLSMELKGKTKKVTFHKPCNIDNYDDVKWVLEHTKNLEYTEMKDFDKCCGLNAIFNFSEYNIIKNLYKEKHDNIKSTGATVVLTSCLGCELVLKFFAMGKYKVEDFIKFLSKNLN